MKCSNMAVADYEPPEPTGPEEDLNEEFEGIGEADLEQDLTNALSLLDRHMWCCMAINRICLEHGYALGNEVTHELTSVFDDTRLFVDEFSEWERGGE